MKETSVKETLEQYASQKMLPMHMPGHKQNKNAAPDLAAFPLELDVTELPGLDDLHEPSGVLAQAMERAAAVWHSENSYFLVNGSTCGILAGIRAATHRGDTVLVARNAHRSVFHAIELCGLRPVFMQPPLLREGCCGSLAPKTVEEALKKKPDARLIILTSPTYEGIISDVQTICRLGHRHGIPVLVDEAHGAHLDLHPAFPGGAVQGGADLVVQSLHKTLPSLTQTALLHRQGNRIDGERLAHQLAVFETSSPSYFFLLSMDGCVRNLQPERLTPWAEALAQFRREAGSWRHLRLMGKQEGVFLQDPSKLVISTIGTDLTGYELSRQLAEESVQPELATSAYVLAMTGLGDTPATLERLSQALSLIDSRLRETTPSSPQPLYPCPVMALPPEQALEAPFEMIPPEYAIGRISAEYLWAYPPGIPLVVPGERIGTLPREGVRSTRGQYPEKIAVVLEKIHSVLDSKENL